MITDQKLWDEWVKHNKDPYGSACIKVARRFRRSHNHEDYDGDGVQNHAVITINTK